MRFWPINSTVQPLAGNEVEVHGVISRYDFLGPEARTLVEDCQVAALVGRDSCTGTNRCVSFQSRLTIRLSKL